MSKLAVVLFNLGGPDGPVHYGGGYAEYVEATGYEAPGVRS